MKLKHFTLGALTAIAIMLIPGINFSNDASKAADYETLAKFSFSKSDGADTAETLWDTYQIDGKAKVGLPATDGVYKDNSRMFGSVAGNIETSSDYNYKKFDWSDENDGFKYSDSDTVTVPIISASTNNPWTGSPFLLYKVTTKGYNDIMLTFDIGGSKKGPRDFILQYSLDGGETYTSIENCKTSIEDNKLLYEITYDSLPDEIENKDTVYLRYIASTANTIGGGLLTDEPDGGKIAVNNVEVLGVKSLQPEATPAPTANPSSVASFTFENLDGTANTYNATLGVLASTASMQVSNGNNELTALNWNADNNSYLYEGNNIDKIAVLGASETAPWGNEPHFLFKLSTEACEDISFSFKLGGTKKAPRNFKLQYSLDNNQFIDIENAALSLENNKILYNYSFNLPNEASNQSVLYVRLIASDTAAIDNSLESYIGLTGGELAVTDITFNAAKVPDASVTPTETPVTEPTVAPTVSPTVAPTAPSAVTPTIAPQVSTGKKLNAPVLKKYKKNTKLLKGNAVKKCKITVKVGSKKYTVTATKKGKFTVKLKSKLKKGTKIKLYATKSGYKKSKTVTYKVK